MSDLKPCPFCPNGGLPEQMRSHVFCGICGTHVPVEVWNSRPIEDEITKKTLGLVEDVLIDSEIDLSKIIKGLAGCVGIFNELLDDARDMRSDAIDKIATTRKQRIKSESDK